MKKTLVTALLALTAALTAGAQSRTEVYTFPSEVLGAEKSCTVYLPDGYDRSQESYPVLYLLHGASGCHTDWTQKGDLRRIADEAIAAGMARPMIVVMPDASGEGPKRTGRHMGYFDVPGWDYERFFFEEFMPAVEKRYRIASDKAHRAVAGLSMGGGGTAVYALRHPELFGSACSMSGLLDMFPGRQQRRQHQNSFHNGIVLCGLRQKRGRSVPDVESAPARVQSGVPPIFSSRAAGPPADASAPRSAAGISISCLSTSSRRSPA